MATWLRPRGCRRLPRKDSSGPAARRCTRAAEVILRGIPPAGDRARIGRRLATQEEVAEEDDRIGEVEDPGVIRVRGVDARRWRLAEEEVPEERDGIRQAGRFLPEHGAPAEAG